MEAGRPVKQLSVPERHFIVRVLIASPSDCHGIRDGMKFSMERWNATHGKAEGVTLVPLRYEEDSVATSGVDGQTAINEQVVSEAHVCVAFFRSKLGTRTANYESGTAEEIAICIERGLKVGLFFWNDPEPLTKTPLKALSPSKRRIVKEKRDLARYKNTIGNHSNRYYYKSYADEHQAVAYGMESVLLQVGELLSKNFATDIDESLDIIDMKQLDSLIDAARILYDLDEQSVEAANNDWNFEIDEEKGCWTLTNKTDLPMTLDSYGIITSDSVEPSGEVNMKPLGGVRVAPYEKYTVEERVPDDGALLFALISLSYRVGNHKFWDQIDNDKSSTIIID